MSEKRLSVGIIGCGRIGYCWGEDQPSRDEDGAWSHFHAFRQADECFEVTACVDPDAGRRTSISVHYPDVTCYPSVDAMLSAHTPQVAVVASPDETHTAIIRGLCESSVRLIFIEKPLVSRVEETKEIITLLHERCIAAQVNFSRRFIPFFQELREDLLARKLGPRVTASIHYSRGLWHNGLHYLDLLLWYFGFPVSIYRLDQVESPFEEDPSCSIHLEFQGGHRAFLLALPQTGNLVVNELSFFGDQGSVRIDSLGGFTIANPRPLKETFGFRAYSEGARGMVGAQHALPAAVRNIHAHLRSGEALLSPVDSFSDLAEIFKVAAER